jgi:diaminohydroxyphosphoribosylaminopyrimidine deaminase/5-amino-6-(5-phosphoribosylamino)uracil reductase
VRQPLRVIVDSRLRMPPLARVLQGGPTLIAYVNDPGGRAAALRQAGAELLQLPAVDGHVCLASLLRELALRDVNELMVEGGAVLNGALLQLGLIDELLLYIAPQLMGDAARPMFAVPELTRMSERTELQMLEMRAVGGDLRLRLRPQRKEA